MSKMDKCICFVMQWKQGKQLQELKNQWISQISDLSEKVQWILPKSNKLKWGKVKWGYSKVNVGH